MRIVKVGGVNGLGRTSGVGAAPRDIIKGLEEIYSNESGKEVSLGKIEVREVNLSGDLMGDNDNIYGEAFSLFSKGKIIFLGGDHSISYPLTNAFFDYNQNEGKQACLIVFDAHPDLMEPVDGKIPTHEEWLRALIEKGFNPKNILLVGIRNSDPSELKFIEEKGIKCVSVEDLVFNLEGRTDAIMEFGYGKEVYVSIDIDVLDPAFAPGTGYCEPGGLSSREFLYILKRLNKMKNLRAVDIVEINPLKDIGGRTVQVGSKIVSELI